MASCDFSYVRVSSSDELRQILAIQKRNMTSGLTTTEKQTEGFITVQHNFEILEKMNDACAHIIAKDRNTVVGYSLVMLRSFKYEIPVLTPMFDTADMLLNTTNYVVMGQICIDKPYRKMGVFKGMYSYYKKQLGNTFDGLFTEVATNNRRSLAAHQNVGFEILKTQVTEGTSWELIYWDWNE